MIDCGHPYWNNNIREDPVISNPAMFSNIVSVLCVPMIANKQAVGALCMGRHVPISDQDVRLLSAIADMAANAIQRQALHEDLQTQLEALHQAQTKLIQSEKLAAIGSLVAGVAHELNNPLTTIILYTQLLQQRQASSDEIQKFADKVIFASRHAANIVRSLLDFARQHPPERKPVQVNDVIKKTLDFLEYELTSRKIECIFQADPHLPITMADPHQLQQVIINLISNAWQAMSSAHKGGTLKVATESESSKYLPGGHDSPPMIRIRIEDDGPGISSEAINRIFDPFFTTKAEGEGTGLGLSVCHGIITEHQGHIWAESEPGQGTTFVVELPVVVPATRASGQPPASPSPESANNRDILIVEDESNVAEIIGRSLRRKGFNVDLANNGVEGLAFVSKKDYDLILCDIRIPEMNGPDFYRKVEAHLPHLTSRFIFMSGDTISPTSRKFLEETQVPYLSKPFELQDLLNKIQILQSR